MPPPRHPVTRVPDDARAVVLACVSHLHMRRSLASGVVASLPIPFFPRFAVPGFYMYYQCCHIRRGEYATSCVCVCMQLPLRYLVRWESAPVQLFSYLWGTTHEGGGGVKKPGKNCGMSSSMNYSVHLPSTLQTTFIDLSINSTKWSWGIKLCSWPL